MVLAAATRRASRRRSAWLSAVSGTLIAAVVSTVAILYDGFEAQRADLNDGALWVTSGERQAVARANVQIGALDALVETEGADLRVRHYGADVVVIDQQNASADVLDVARAQIDYSVPLPPTDADVQFVGETVVVHTSVTGELWTVPWVLFDDFDTTRAAPLSFGPGSRVAATEMFGVLVAAPSTGEIHRLAPDRLDRVAETWEVPATDASDLELTIAAGTWWAYEPETRTLWRDGEPIDLSAVVGEGDVALAQPSDTATELVVATSSGAVAVSATGELRTIVSDRAGAPVAPVVIDGCTIIAWADASAWRSCANPPSVSLTGLVPTDTLEFVVRDTRVVLNDRASGAVWDVLGTGALIDNWDDLLAQEQDERDEVVDALDVPPETERVQQPPVAVDDEFGARPGRSTVLPVLLNDSDPNGDVLVISEVTELDASLGRLDIVDSAQKVQLTLPPDASGVLSFGYTITDGRGGSDSATVVVTVRQPFENGAPFQVRPARTTVAEGGRVSANVLGEWVDPDGDPIFLEEVSVASPDQVASRPDGRVTFAERGGVGELRSVQLRVSDGALAGDGELAVTVRPAGQVPIIAEPFAVQAFAGQEVRIEPLRSVRGGSGVIRLVSVPERAGAVITPRLERGFFRFSSDEVRTHYVEYVVSDGDQTATGLVRVDVSAPPELAVPITVPKTAYVRSLSSATVAVATTDIDPAGGVLVVTGVTDVPSGSGIRAEVIDQRDVRISLTHSPAR